MAHRKLSEKVDLEAQLEERIERLALRVRHVHARLQPRDNGLKGGLRIVAGGRGEQPRGGGGERLRERVQFRHKFHLLLLEKAVQSLHTTQ